MCSIILDNYFKTINIALYSDDYSRTEETIYDITGTPKVAPVKSGLGSNLMNMKAKLKNINSAGDFCLMIGSDDTPVTKQDYAWTHDIGLTDSGGSVGCTNRDGNRVFRVTRSYANNTSEDIEVKEVGLVFYTRGIKVLIAREVLPEPVVVKANGGIQAFGIDLF